MEDKMIYDFIDRFENSKLSVMKIETEGFKLHLEKGAPQMVAPVAQTSETVQMPAPTLENTPGSALIDNSYEKVKSPIVGVFYESPSPNDPPYAKVGDRVTKGQVLCLVEAMKMMNELKSPVNGVVKNIFGQNGELVEFDQVLFEVEEC